MKKETKDKYFVKQPVYPGGIKAIREYISSNLQYPEEAVANKVEGTVNLKYEIDYKGNVTDIKVVSGIGYGCDEEAVRLVKNLKFNVERNYGVRVVFHKTLQIHFRLPKKQKSRAQQPQQMQYNYVTSSPTQAPEKKTKEGATYSYTITLNRS